MAEAVTPDTLTSVNAESLFPVDTVKRWWAKRAYPGFVDRIPSTVSTDDISKSIENYLRWLTDENVPSYSIEPGRSAIWAHVTSFRGLDKIATTGFIRSAKRVLTEGGSIGHGAGGKVKRFVGWYKISPNSTLRKLSTELQTKILSTVDDDVAGTLGHLCQEYSVPADIDVTLVRRDQEEEKIENQYALIYPVDYLLKRYGRLYLPGERHKNDNDPYGMLKLNKNRDMLKILPYPIRASAQDWEYQIVMDMERGTEVPLDKCLIFVPDVQVDRVKVVFSAADRNVPIVTFPTIFRGINQAAGWLTNSPEGRYYFEEATGVDPLDVALQPISRKEVEWAVRNLHGELRKLGVSRTNLISIPNALSHVEAKTNYYEGILQDIEDIFQVNIQAVQA